MTLVSLKILFAHWFAFLDALQQFFWNYTARPLLSSVLPQLIEDGSGFSQMVHVPRIGHPSDYIGSVTDLATICVIPAIFQAPLAMNFSCLVNPPDYDASSVNSSHHYVFPDILVWRPAVPDEDMPPTSPWAQVGDDRTQTKMVPYETRGLSFCPVLVGFVYIHSLLHLYMLLMIPSLCNHWFEDVLVYESLNPIELLDRSWFLHRSLWMVPWHLLRHGVRKVVSCLHRIRLVTCKSARPPIPQIVLIRVDGEAVPVNLVEDPRPSANVDVRSSFEAEILGTDDGLDAASDGGGHQDSMQSLNSGRESCTAIEFEALPERIISDQGEHQSGVSDAQNVIGPGSLASAFTEDSQLFGSQVLQEQLQIYPVRGETSNEPLQAVEEDIPISGRDTLVAIPSDCDIDERTIEFEQMAFLKAVVNDVRQEGTEGIGEPEDTDKDPIAFSLYTLIDNPGPDETGTSSETVSTTSSFVGLQITPSPAKNVRFAVGDGAWPEDHQGVSSSSSHPDEYTYTWNHGSQLGDDGAAPVLVPVLPFDHSMDKQDAMSPTSLTKLILPVVLSEERAEENVELAESLSPSLTGKPIVSLPSLVTIREDIRFVEMVPMVPAALIEDVATRSPLQIHSPIAPVVVINMNCVIEVEEQDLTPLGTEERQGVPLAGQGFGTLNDMEVSRGMSDIASPSEDRSYPPSLSIEGSNLVFSPIFNREPSLDGIRPHGIALSALEAASEVNMPAAGTSVVATHASLSAAMDVPGVNKRDLGVEVLYETPRYYADGKEFARSLQNALQGPEVSVSDAMITSICLATVSESPKEPDVEDQANVVAAEKSDSVTISLTGQPAGHSSVLPTKLLSPFLDSCEQAGPPPMTSAEKRIRKLDNEENRKADALPRVHPSLISKPPPGRTLSGSMHAPPEPLPTSQPNSHVDQTSVLYETPPFVTFLARPEEKKEGTSMTTETTSKRKQDLSASIHAPQRTSKPEVQSSVAQPRDESHRDHRRSVTNPAAPEKTPCGPNWAAMPEVVNAFRMFKQAPSGNTIRRVSSIAESLSRGPMLGVTSQKGVATNSLNNISVTANIQNRWMCGDGLLLVRDVVSSEPADFNLRNCTSLRRSRMHCMNTMPVRQALYPGTLDIPPYALQHGITACPVGVNADFSSTVAGSTGVQRQSRCHAGAAQGRGRDDALLSALDDLPGLKEVEIL